MSWKISFHLERDAPMELREDNSVKRLDWEERTDSRYSLYIECLMLEKEEVEKTNYFKNKKYTCRSFRHPSKFTVPLVAVYENTETGDMLWEPLDELKFFLVAYYNLGPDFRAIYEQFEGDKFFSYKIHCEICESEDKKR